MAALMALAASWAAFGTVVTVRAAEWFIAFSMCILAILKLRDLEGFSNMFLGYDLLAQRVVRYAYPWPNHKSTSESTKAPTAAAPTAAAP